MQAEIQDYIFLFVPFLIKILSFLKILQNMYIHIEMVNDRNL